MIPLAATAKGTATRQMIVERAYDIASRHGLEGLSIGELAAVAGMSKSGVFAHFGSREDLQLTVLDWTARRFSESVMALALSQKRGLPRLRAMVLAWFEWVMTNPDGCLIMAAAGEYDGRPGPMRDRILAWLTEWRVQLAKAVGHCIDSGELGPATDTDLAAFEIFSLALGLHYARFHNPDNARALALRAFDRLLVSYST